MVASATGNAAQTVHLPISTDKDPELKRVESRGSLNAATSQKSIAVASIEIIETPISQKEVNFLNSSGIQGIEQH